MVGGLVVLGGGGWWWLMVGGWWWWVDGCEELCKYYTLHEFKTILGSRLRYLTGDQPDQAKHEGQQVLA